jgi:carnitine O-acetyltransferase
MRADYLSTSSAPSPNISYFGFGSTSASCIGVAYVLLADRFNVYLSAPRPLSAELHAFADELRRAVPELRSCWQTVPSDVSASTGLQPSTAC